MDLTRFKQKMEVEMAGLFECHKTQNVLEQTPEQVEYRIRQAQVGMRMARDIKCTSVQIWKDEIKRLRKVLRSVTTS